MSRISIQMAKSDGVQETAELSALGAPAALDVVARSVANTLARDRPGVAACRGCKHVFKQRLRCEVRVAYAAENWTKKMTLYQPTVVATVGAALAKSKRRWAMSIR